MPARAPDLVGRVGQAWKVNVGPATLDDRQRLLSSSGTSLDSYVVTGPWHPFWDHWLVYLVSLKDIPGIDPPKKSYPEAEYELAIWSLQAPDGQRSGMKASLADIEAGRKGFAILTPPDAVNQFHGLTPDEANSVLRLVVTAIVGGRASPDSDWRNWWRVYIENTVRHARGEAHLPQGGGT